jgi:hypothetical protein
MKSSIFTPKSNLCHRTKTSTEKPRAGYSFAEALNAITAENLWKWKQEIADLNWNTGRSKHMQVQSGFASAAARGIDPEQAKELLVEMIEKHGGEVVPRDIERIRNWAYNRDDSIDCQKTRMPRPLFNRDFAEHVAGRVSIGDPVEFVKSRSPIPCESPSSADVLENLYSEHERVLIFDVFESQGQCVYQIGSGSDGPVPTGGPDGAWFLIQPVDGKSHPNPREGMKLSRRSEESVTAFRYMLLESDELDEQTWLCICVQLRLRIAAIYRSGGKSVHVLIRVDADDKQHYDQIKAGMMSMLVTLGADRQALSAVRLSRLPQAWRGDQRQVLLYLNPDPQRVRLIDLPLRSETSTPEDDE